MKLVLKYRLLSAAVIICSGFLNLMAQIQYPGLPTGDYHHLKAADLIYMLAPVDRMEIDAAIQCNSGSDKKPVQFAIERPLDLDPVSHGQWTRLEDSQIWRIHIISPGAYSLGLVFNEFVLKEGVKLFVYDPDQEYVKGAFTSGNNKQSHILAVGHLPGDELIIELQLPEGVEDFGLLRIESLSHAFMDLTSQDPDDDCPAGEFGCSQECEIDINCEEGSEWQLSKKSVVRIYNSRQYCTGVLLNNTAYDGTPYILTSEHCVNNEYYADRSVFAFNYESPRCFGGNGSLFMSVSGSDSIVTGDSIDFSLLKLSSPPPPSYDVYYAGWDLINEQVSHTVNIHHPWGDVKKISYDFQAPSEPASLQEVPDSDLRDYFYFSYWWIKEWNIGCTEAGSSGSPLFNAGQRVIGTLSGGKAECGLANGFDPLANRTIFSKVPNKNDYFTKLNIAWDYNGSEGPSLKPWLDPENTGAYRIGGYLPISANSGRKTAARQYMVYPNPASSLIHISTNSISSGEFSYVLYDLSGKMQISGTGYGHGTHNIHVDSLPSGIYHLGILAKGEMEYHKIIILR